MTINHKRARVYGYELLTDSQLDMLGSLFDLQYASGVCTISGNCTGMHSFSFIESHVTFWTAEDFCVPAHVPQENAYVWYVNHGYCKVEVSTCAK